MLPLKQCEKVGSLKKWLEDRVIERPSVRTVPTAEDEKHSRFCIYHRKISHSAMDCYVLRDIFDKKISKVRRA